MFLNTAQNFINKVLERDKLHKLLEESEGLKKLDLIDKKKRFSKLIADTWKPKISKKKRMEVQKRLDHSTSKDRKFVYSIGLEDYI